VSTREGPDEERDGDRTLERLLGECEQLEREIIELEYVRRSDALERVRDAIRRLGEVGAAEGIFARAADELGEASQFDRVLISEVHDGGFTPRAMWTREQRGAAADALAELGQAPIALAYPLVEQEVVARQQAEVVSVIAAGSRTPGRLASVLGWESYVVGALAVEGRTVGLLHADAHRSRRAMDELDREVAARYGQGLAGVLERAALRETLRGHRDDLQTAVQWISGRLTRLAAQAPIAGATVASPSSRSSAVDALTPRELDVMRLMARGQTNMAIAHALVVREGTVKYHVKNLLRKLGATSRADAVARYVRATAAQRL
jgi:DNA-binding CsgD family transcriptional regulator